MSYRCNKGVVLDGRAREIVFKVQKFFSAESHRANDLLSEINIASNQAHPDGPITLTCDQCERLTDFLKESLRVTQRVALATGVSKNTVTKIKKEGAETEAGTKEISTPKRKSRGKTFVLDDFDIKALNELINECWENEAEPSVNKIYRKAKKHLNFQGSRSTFGKIVKTQLGNNRKLEAVQLITLNPTETVTDLCTVDMSS